LDEPLPTDDFWKPRPCFLAPPPQIEQGVKLLDRAADALLSTDRETAVRSIVAADVEAICEYVQLVHGKYVHEIRRYREVPDAPPVIEERARDRMPDRKTEREIFIRDGWMCRFCGTRLISKRARERLTAEFPEHARWGPTNADKHCAFRATLGVIDHVLPHSRGGSSAPENLVAACGPCNYGRGELTLEHCGLEDPRTRPPIVNGWDGLSRLD